MMYIQSRRRKTAFPFSSFLSNSFCFFSLHFPLNLNCQTNCKRRKLTPSEDPNSELSSSSTATHGGDHEGGNEQLRGNAYEVFLSFRGTDTRKGFTDHLYTNLVDAGVCVFRDDNELRVGEEIGLELLHSIMQSTISIPIISENYASSKWCLRELAEILKCKRSRGQIVLPIFYKVEPSQVRHLKGRFGDAINAHKKDLAEELVKEWEEALQEVGSLKGLELEKIENGHEGAFVKNVVTKVMGELKRAFQLIIPQQLVGIDDHIKEIMSLIDTKCKGTLFIGIYGMGGVGKTTLAKVLYNKLSGYFDNCRFVANCHETYKREGMKCLQKQLLSDHRSSHDVFNEDEGIHLIKFRFANKKTLIFLDDVDDNDHLKCLVDRGWLKVGSMVIITTRNKDVLCQANVDIMYPLNELSLYQSLILFSRHAFRRDSPPSDREAISRDVVSTTGGLPLALEVIGSFLHGKGENVWEDALKKLKKIPHEKVQEKLKISYETLNYQQQQIFLDIACLFIGSKKQNPIYMWDGCDFFRELEIEVLSLMSLIKIGKDGELLMHDQLRDLGRNIVFQQNPKEPQERTRLWIYDEALDVLDNCKATRNIEALSFGKYGKGRTFTAKQFKKMTNLRFLQADDANFTGNFQSLLPKLRWLQWQDCPSIFAATNFHLKKLVILDLSDSAITEDWEGWFPLKEAAELKVLNLSGCRSLKRTPELSTFIRLKILNLLCCRDLEELHHSIENLASLIELNLEGTSIRKLPESIGNLQNLSILNINFTHVTELPDAIEKLAKLQTLTACNCLNLKRLPSNMCKLILLENLWLRDCKKLRELPEPPSGLTDLSITCQGPSLPRLSQLTRLKRLDLYFCHGLECVPELPIGVSRLRIDGCGKLKALTTNLSDLKHLKVLNINECPSLERVPELPSELQFLVIKGCPSLECVPKLPIGLLRLFIDNCRKLKALTPDLLDLKHLELVLIFGCPSLEESPGVLNRRRRIKGLEPAEISADP